MKKLMMALALLPLMAAAETWYDSKTGYTWTYSLASAYEGWGDGCEWFDVDDDSVVLEAVSPIPNGELQFPSLINGHTVKVLGRYFMEEVDTIKRVVFPASMKYVCNGVFDDCPNLTVVVLNDGFLGGPRHYKAFGNCAVSKWELPASMRYMNFAKNPVDAITIRGGNNNCYCVKNGILLHSSQADGIYDELCCVPRKITAFEVGEEVCLIDRYAFYGNEMLSCDLSNTKVVCLYEAFKRCPNLKSVKFPVSLQEIVGIPFENCNLDRVTFEGAVPTIWNEFNPPDVSDGWYCCLYAADDHYRRINGNIVTCVFPNKGWDDIVASGTWQGRPIKFIDGEIPQGGDDDTADWTVAHNFSGVVYDAGENCVGMIQIATKKATKKGVGVSGTMMLQDGKKITLKSMTVAPEGGALNVAWTVKGYGKLNVIVEAEGFSGQFDDGGSVESQELDEDTGVLKASITMTYIDKKTGKMKTKKITFGGFVSGGEGIGTAQAGKKDPIKEVEFTIR